MSGPIKFFTLISLFVVAYPMVRKESKSEFFARNKDKISFLREKIMYYPDFPKPGILFANFLPILKSPEAFQICIDLLYEWTKNSGVDLIVGLESRGFLIGAALAHKLGVGFVPVRKPGKLPGAVLSFSYEKEYGTDALEISQDKDLVGKRIIIVDDLMATGGTAKAAINLINQAGGIPIELITLLQVRALAANAHLEIPWFNLID